jgi:hypothetical protein
LELGTCRGPPEKLVTADEQPKPETPQPGSEPAIALGCTCRARQDPRDVPVKFGGFDVTENCPLHDPGPPLAPLPPPPPRLTRSVRKDLVRQVAGHLWDRETPRYALYAAYGPTNYTTRRLQPHYGIVITDRGILVFPARRGLKFKPAEHVRRLPRSTRLALAGHTMPYRRAALAGEPIWVHWQFWKDARGADAELNP